MRIHFFSHAGLFEGSAKKFSGGFADLPWLLLEVSLSCCKGFRGVFAVASFREYSVNNDTPPQHVVHACTFREGEFSR